MRGKLSIAVVLLFSFVVVTSANAEDAAALYKAKCQSCHGANGKGDTYARVRLGAPDFHANSVAWASDAAWFKIIKFGKSKMPGHPALTDEQIQELITFVRTLK